ncbi:hypothetical protein V8C42DRAFT_320756 [Trichoderma barbatum]
MGGVCACLITASKQAATQHGLSLHVLSVCPCVLVVSRCVSLHVSPPCCLMLLPGSHCRACLYVANAATQVRTSSKRDAGCRDDICHERDQADVSALSNSGCI